MLSSFSFTQFAKSSGIAPFETYVVSAGWSIAYRDEIFAHTPILRTCRIAHHKLRGCRYLGFQLVF